MAVKLDDFWLSGFDIEARKVLTVRESHPESVLPHIILLDHDASQSRENYTCL